MTILFVTENERRKIALDLVNLRSIPVTTDLDEDLFPICTPVSETESLATEMSQLKVEEFVSWWNETYKLTNRFDRLWSPDPCTYQTLQHFPPRLVISTHTLIEDDHHVMGKTSAVDEMRDALFRLRDRGMTYVHTALTVHDLLSNRTYTDLSSVSVNFRFDIADSLIENYINTGEPFEGDGSFLFNGRALFLIRSIMGEPLSIMGMPSCKLHQILRKLGIDISSLWIR